MATRFYFPAATAADVTPPAPTSWTSTTGYLVRRMEHVKGSDAITIGSTISWGTDTFLTSLDRVYVSHPMGSGNLFTASTTLFKLQLMVREYAGTDNVDRLHTKIYIVSNDGSTIKATLEALAPHGGTTEFINNATHRNKSGASAGGSALDAGYTTILGDRLVVEIGYSASTSHTTPQVSAKWGQNASDLPENETQTTDGAGWIEFSNNISWADQKIRNINQSVKRSNSY